jgi:drug/metabolite transporter (DMT)-like permease
MQITDNTKAWLAFASVAFFWGTTYLAIRIGVASFPPLLFAGLRHLTAGLIILTYFIIRRYKLPPKDQMKHIVVMAMMMLGIGNGLLVWAEKYISSGLTAIISATFPFAVFFFGWITGVEKINRYVLAGIILGFIGQIFIFYDKLEQLQNPEYRWGIVALFVAITCWGYGAIYRKKANITLHSLYFAGWQMVIAGIGLLPFALIRGEFAHLPEVETDAIWAFLYLVVFGSIVAYGSFMFVLNKMPATIASMYSHINTIVAVILGWLVLDERLNWNIAFSTVFTLVGVYLVNSGINKIKKPLTRRL